MDVIKDLLRIKIFREEKAELDLLKKKYDLSSKEKQLLKSRSDLEEYKEYFQKKEIELYEDLCSRLVVQKDIDNVSIEIQQMKNELSKHEERVESAKEQRNEAALVVSQAKIVHQEAVRMREKFMEIRKIQDSERKIELDRVEDIEMEEVAEQRFSRKEDQSEELLENEW